MNLDADLLKRLEIFHPHWLEKVGEIELKKTRFVHYTRAEAALSILKNEEVWLRRTTCQNDYMEVQHGLDCLYSSYPKSRFRTAIEAIYPGINEEISNLFEVWKPHLQVDTYLICVSEHRDEEDKYGRLSMWRAYGHGTGVALVMNSTPFFGQSDALKAYTSPVAYMDDAMFAIALDKVGANIENNADYIKQMGREGLIGQVFHMLKFAALCTKHPGFGEELEWRIVYTPRLEKSEHVLRSIEIINSVPQPVQKIPLKNIPDEQLLGVQIPELLNRIIIGPTQFPSSIREAFVDQLKELGVQDADQKVVMSDIPLRISS